jgi:hypothetical protein
MEDQKLLLIDDCLFIAEGCTKKCYRHPNDATLIIKIIKEGSTKKQYKRYVVRIKREVKALKKVMKINELKNFFPKYYGTVDTNLGTGYIFEKIEKPIDAYKDPCIVSRALYKEIIHFLRLIIKYNVPCCADFMRNVFVVDKTGKFYFLDGLGCKYYVPTSMPPFPFFVRKMVMLRIMKKHTLINLKELRSKVKGVRK